MQNEKYTKSQETLEAWSKPEVNLISINDETMGSASTSTDVDLNSTLS